MLGLARHEWELTPSLILILLMRARDDYIVDQPSMASLALEEQYGSNSNADLDHMSADGMSADGMIWGHIVYQGEEGFSAI